MATTKVQARAIKEIRKLIDMKNGGCGVFMSSGHGIPQAELDKLADRMHLYLTTWVEIELMKIEGSWKE